MPALKAAYRTARVIVSAMMGALVFYVVIVEVVSRVVTLDPVIAGVPVAVRYGIYAVVVTIVFLTQVVRGMMTRLPAADETALASRMMMVSVVTGALAETPAILGLVSFFVWREHTDFYVMTAISVYLFLRHYPRWPSWENLARQRIARS